MAGGINSDYAQQQQDITNQNKAVDLANGYVAGIKPQRVYVPVSQGLLAPDQQANILSNLPSNVAQSTGQQNMSGSNPRLVFTNGRWSFVGA